MDKFKELYSKNKKLVIGTGAITVAVLASLYFMRRRNKWSALSATENENKGNQETYQESLNE